MYKHTDVLENYWTYFGMLVKLPWETNYIFNNLVSTAKLSAYLEHISAFGFV